jgi:predicted phage terminase large subunit-like protein
MTEYNFSAQYQQCPIPLGGAMVKTAWLKYYDPGELPDELSSIVQSWDTANKATDLSDFSVCTTWGVRNKRFYLIDVFRRRLNYPELKQAARDLAQQYNANRILIEDKASGPPLIQDLQSEGLIGVTACEPPAGTDKIMRLHLQTDLFANGHVFLPKQAPWLVDYVNELIGFPGTKFDDQVDSTTQALQFLKAGFDLDAWMRFAENSPKVLNRLWPFRY